MWKLDDWGIFFICTIFLMPIGIALCIIHRRNRYDVEVDHKWDDRYISQDVIEEFR